MFYVLYGLCSSTSWIAVHIAHSVHGSGMVGLWAYVRECECECVCAHNVPKYTTTHYSGSRMIVSHFIRCCCCCFCCCTSAQWVTLTFSWEIISLSFLMCGFHAHTHSITYTLTLFFWNLLTCHPTISFYAHSNNNYYVDRTRFNIILVVRILIIIISMSM